MATATADNSAQVRLSSNQVEAFYHNLFVAEQVADFEHLVDQSARGPGIVVDVGGGQGYFAESIRQKLGIGVRVLDLDPVSVQACQARGLDARLADALQPPIVGDERVACFNLVLHHLVGRDGDTTRSMQTGAIAVWRGSVPLVFVNEYIYESFMGDFSGWLIFQLTGNRVLSALCKAVSGVIPSLRANTFGVGVRFRSHRSWSRLFSSSGYEIRAVRIGKPEKIAWPLRALFIRQIRRDSFLLAPFPGSWP